MFIITSSGTGRWVSNSDLCSCHAKEENVVLAVPLLCLHRHVYVLTTGAFCVLRGSGLADGEEMDHGVLRQAWGAQRPTRVALTNG